MVKFLISFASLNLSQLFCRKYLTLLNQEEIIFWLKNKKRQHREISSVLCDHLEEWDREGGRETQEGGGMGIYVYVELIHFVIKQKRTHHCKAIILQ